VLTCGFVDGAASLPLATRSEIASLASAAHEDVRTFLPVEEHVHLVIGPTSTPIASTGDTAYTEAPDLIHWCYDERRDPVDTARAHLREAYFHEAFHAARFRRLRHEAGLERWSNVALGEGLACVFAREFADAHEEWTRYDAAVMRAWARELFGQPWSDFERWKFQHEDGRERIAFRVGVWLVDRILGNAATTVCDLVWTPVEDLEALTVVADLLAS